jgi:hypothetical protein
MTERLLFGGLFLLLLTGLVQAQDKWGPHIDFEAKPGSKRTLGEADLFVPIVQDPRTLWFGNLRGRFDDQSNREGNLGLGVRRMLGGGWNLGGYGYLDRRKSESGQFYSQVTLGGEALGRDWDLRANAYLPQGDRVRDLGSTTTVTTTAGGASFVSIAGSTVQIVTPGATTMTAVSTVEERALRGYDAELGWRVPLFDLDAPRELRVYAGGFRFKDEVAKVQGPRLRLELAMAELPYLWRGAQLIAGVEAQDDNVRGGQRFLSVRLRVPLGGGDERASPRGVQERRMTAPVMRDVDIVTQGRTVSSSTTTAEPALVETATLSTGQSFFLVDSTVIDGSQVPAAVAAAGANSLVILSGTFNAGAQIVLQSGQTVTSGGATLALRTSSGRTGSLATSAGTVNAGDDAFFMGGNSTLSGLSINGTHTGITNNVSGATIENNTIVINNTSGTAVGIVGSSDGAAIRNNTITVTVSAGAGSGASTLGLGGATNVLITGNTFSANGGAAQHTAVLNNTSIAAGSTGNVRVSGDCQLFGSNTGSIGFTNGTTCP